MELESMYDSDMSSTLQDHVEELSMEDLDDHAHDLKSTPSMISTTALTASTSPKMADGSDQSWLRRLERDMDTKLLVDAERINERIQRRKAHEEEMQQSLASFTNSARVSASSSSAAAPSAHSSTKSSFTSMANANASSSDSTDDVLRQVTTAHQPPQVVDEWKQAFTEDGKTYYYNRRTRETSWTCPENAIVVNRSATAAPTPVDHSMVGTSTDSVATPATTTTTTTTVTMHQSKKSMFCMFCGLECRVWELMPHMSSCDLLRTNKAQRTAMYEEAVDIASALLNKQTSDADTQTTDRYLHYASLYSLHHDDSSRDQRGNVLDPLALLKQRRRHTMQPTTTSSSSTLRRHQRDDDDDHDVMHLNVDDDTKLSLLRLKRSTEAAQSRRQDVSELCRYCHRSFAEGRLSKHEAVCPRVFGSEMTWNNHQGKKDTANKSLKGTTNATPKPRPKAPTPPHPKSSLAGSFHEHQATLVTCPCCQRKFAPSGAQQHIDICQHVENKPKKITAKAYVMAG